MSDLTDRMIEQVRTSDPRWSFAPVVIEAVDTIQRLEAEKAHILASDIRQEEHERERADRAEAALASAQAERDEARAERDDWAELARAGRTPPDPNEPWPHRAVERVAELEMALTLARQEAAAAQNECASLRVVVAQEQSMYAGEVSAHRTTIDMLARLQQERDADAENCRLMQDRLQRLIDGSQAWQQEREGLIAILQRCAGWVLIRIESNIEQHGMCASRECGYVAGTNADCPVCRWIINARMFYEDITKALLAATPPTETQEPPR